MRITNAILNNNMINYLGSNLNRLSKYQDMLATGKKIQVPSDDPVIAARALKLRTDVSEVEQYRRNAEDAQAWMEITDNTLSNITEVVQRIRELTVQAANGTNTAGDMQKIKEEANQLKYQLIHLSNNTYAGRYIFSGFKTDKPLIEETSGNFLIDVTNTEDIKFEIGIGDDININVPGGELFNNGVGTTTGTKGKFLTDIDKIISDMDSGNYNTVSSDIALLDENIENLLRIRADLGARQNRLELTLNRLGEDGINFTRLMSKNEDADMAEVIMNLKSEENVYRSSLAGGARIIQTSLVDFLR